MFWVGVLKEGPREVNCAGLAGTSFVISWTSCIFFDPSAEKFRGIEPRFSAHVKHPSTWLGAAQRMGKMALFLFQTTLWRNKYLRIKVV